MEHAASRIMLRLQPLPLFVSASVAREQQFGVREKEKEREGIILLDTPL